MAYTGTTFITFPNGDTIDVSGLTQSVSGKSLMLKNPGGSTAYQFNFGSAGDAQAFSNRISTVISAFNNNPITYYMWSDDGSNWQFGPIPQNTAPIYIQVNGQNLGSASSAILTDASGQEFTITADALSDSMVVVGPFAQPGSNAPSLGSAKLVLYNSSGIATGSTVLTVGQAVYPPTATCLWSTDNATWFAFPIPIDDTVNWYIQVNGTGLPTTGTMVTFSQIVNISGGSSTQIASDALAVNGGFNTSWDLQVFDAGNNLIVTIPNGVQFGS